MTSMISLASERRHSLDASDVLDLVIVGVSGVVQHTVGKETSVARNEIVQALVSMSGGIVERVWCFGSP